MNKFPPFVGIDFGTFSSKVAGYDHIAKRAEIIKNDKGDDYTPSIVYLGRHLLIGRRAEEMLKYPQNTQYVIASIKRDLNLTSASVPGETKDWQKYEIIAQLLTKLKKDAEKLHFGKDIEITRAVITCPATFHGTERELLAKAAHLAGFEEIELLDEPVAAALAYTQQYPDRVIGKHVLVYDLGAGTFDLTILKHEDQTFGVAYEPAGIARCGGDDFDAALYDHIEKIIEKKYKRPIGDKGRRDLQFLQDCRRCKESLLAYDDENDASDDENDIYKFNSTLTYGPLVFDETIDRITFESLISPIIEETLVMVEETLEKAKKKAGISVDTLLLIGGSTRIKLVQKLLAERFPSLDQLPWQHSTVAVALGAAYYGEPTYRYYRALKGAWKNDRLDNSKIKFLQDLAEKLELRRSEREDNQRKAFSGQTIEDLLDQQKVYDRYYKAVNDAWADHFLDPQDVDILNQLGKDFHDAKKSSIQKIEIQVMGAPKETILMQQTAPTKYLAAIMIAWANQTLTHAKQQRLTGLARSLRLDDAQCALIECDVMGKRLSEEVQYQDSLRKYRKAVKEIRDQKKKARKITRREIFQLYQLADQLHLHLDDPQIHAIEREIIGDIKEKSLEQHHPISHSSTTPTQDSIFHFVGCLLSSHKEQITDITAITFSQDGDLLVCCSKDAKVYAWQLIKKNDLGIQDWKSALQLIIACHNSDTLSKSESTLQQPLREWYRPIREWWRATQFHTHQLPGVHLPIATLALSPDGEILALGYDNGTVELWKWQNNKKIDTKKYKWSIKTIAFSSNGALLAIGGKDATLKIWEWQEQREKNIPFRKQIGSITSITFSPDDQLLVAGSATGKIGICNFKTGSCSEPPSAHENVVNAIAFHPQNTKTFISGSLDTFMYVWSHTGNKIEEMRGHTDGINKVVFSPDGQLIVSGSINREIIRFWGNDSKNLIQTITGLNGPIHTLTFSPDGALLLVSGESRTINIYEGTTNTSEILQE